MTRGQNMLEEAKKQTDLVKAEKIRMQAHEMLKTGGQVFGRLSERFPQHTLAGKTLLLSAQCFMQAEDYPSAIKGFDAIAASAGMDKEIVAEAMYWTGHTYMLTDELENAYRKFTRLTEDYPASQWAKFARGRLQDPKIVNKVMEMMK